MGRLVKHSDVQTLLFPGLGLPHIDLAYAHSVDDAEVIADEDEELQDGAIPIADVAADDRVLNLSASPALGDLGGGRGGGGRSSAPGMRTARTDSSMTLSSLPESLPSSFSIAVDDVEDVDGSPMHGGSNAGGSVGGNQLVAVSQDEQNSQLALRQQSRWHTGKVNRQDLVFLSQQDYLTMTHARAAVVGAQASAALKQVSNRLVAANKQKRSAVRTAAVQRSRSSKKLEDVQRAKETQSALVLSTKPSGKRLTAKATLALGIRRNIAHVAAADFGALLMQDISGSTVLRAEVRTGAALVASMRDHVSTAMSLLRESRESDAGIDDVGADGANLSDIAYNADRWHLLFISVRADATNSSIWRREKLHVTEAEIGLVKSSVKDFPTSSDEFLNVR